MSAGFAGDGEAYTAYRANALKRRVAIPVIAAQLQAIAAHETLTRLHQLMMPTLIVHGTADEIIPAGNAHLIAAQISGSRIEILDGVGHLFFWSAPSARPSSCASTPRSPHSADAPIAATGASKSAHVR